PSFNGKLTPSVRSRGSVASGGVMMLGIAQSAAGMPPYGVRGSVRVSAQLLGAASLVVVVIAVAAAAARGSVMEPAAAPTFVTEVPAPIQLAALPVPAVPAVPVATAEDA